MLSTPSVGSAARARLFAEGLDFPTSLAFDAAGRLHIGESGLTFGARPGVAPNGRVLRLEPDGGATLVAEGLRAPVNGLLRLDDAFVVSEGGNPGRLSFVSLDGERRTILDGLPGLGNYHTNMAVLGADRKLYFSQGAMTNSGIVGLDAYELGWLRRLPHDCDLPGLDVTLTGVEIETPNPLLDATDRVPGERISPTARTGAFAPFGQSHGPGRRLTGRTPPTAAVLRCEPDGSALELVAWGLRNAYGLCVMPDGRLLATDQGADDRGSRPIGGAPDLLYEVKEGHWYGWPDFVGGVPVTEPRFVPTRGPAPTFLLANHDELPPPEGPLVEFPVNAAATKLALVPATAARWPGQLLVTLFGDERPMTAPPGRRVGRSLARIDPADWSLHPVALPAAIGERLERPIDVAVSPDGRTVWILDFGGFEMTTDGVEAVPGSGGVWRIPMDELQ